MDALPDDVLAVLTERFLSTEDWRSLYGCGCRALCARLSRTPLAWIETLPVVSHDDVQAGRAGAHDILRRCDRLMARIARVAPHLTSLQLDMSVVAASVDVDYLLRLGYFDGVVWPALPALRRLVINGTSDARMLHHLVPAAVTAPGLIDLQLLPTPGYASHHMSNLYARPDVDMAVFWARRLPETLQRLSVFYGGRLPASVATCLPTTLLHLVLQCPSVDDSPHYLASLLPRTLHSLTCRNFALHSYAGLPPALKALSVDGCASVDGVEDAAKLPDTLTHLDGWCLHGAAALAILPDGLRHLNVYVVNEAFRDDTSRLPPALRTLVLPDSAGTNTSHYACLSRSVLPCLTSLHLEDVSMLHLDDLVLPPALVHLALHMITYRDGAAVAQPATSAVFLRSVGALTRLQRLALNCAAEHEEVMQWRAFCGDVLQNLPRAVLRRCEMHAAATEHLALLARFTGLQAIRFETHEQLDSEHFMDDRHQSTLPRALTDLHISGARSICLSFAAWLSLPPTLTRLILPTHRETVTVTTDVPPHLTRLRAVEYRSYWM